MQMPYKFVAAIYSVYKNGFHKSFITIALVRDGAI